MFLPDVNLWLALAFNLIQLHHAMRHAGLIADDTTSVFCRDDAGFETFMKSMDSTFSLYRDGRGIDHGLIWKGEWEGRNARLP